MTEVAQPEAASLGLRPGGYRPHVKICGVRTVDEAILAIEFGADLIGLNFFPPSPRYLDEIQAADLVATVDTTVKARLPERKVQWVGVFVNRPVSEVEVVGRRVGLDLLQFHGDERPEDVAPVAERAIKAFRVKDSLDAGVLQGWLELGAWGFVIDSRHPTLYGGSGESWNFESLNDPSLASLLANRRVLIAGGLSPDNVRAALGAAQPWGIDLCSGIEAAPGKKDPELMRRLFEEIRHVESISAP